MDLEIRKMSANDIDRVLVIEEASFHTPWSRFAFQAELQDNRLGYYIVTLCGEELVGYAGMWLVINEAHITTLAVHPQWRGGGIASRIIVALLEEARCRDCTCITLEVRPSNTPARRLYEKFDFTVRAVRKGYYNTEDALVMWKGDLNRDVKAQAADSRD